MVQIIVSSWQIMLDWTKSHPTYFFHFRKSVSLGYTSKYGKYNILSHHSQFATAVFKLLQYPVNYTSSVYFVLLIFVVSWISSVFLLYLYSTRTHLSFPSVCHFSALICRCFLVLLYIFLFLCVTPSTYWHFNCHASSLFQFPSFSSLGIPSVKESDTGWSSSQRKSLKRLKQDRSSWKIKMKIMC